MGISSYSAERTRQAAEIARELGTPLLIHQPSYSMINRWIEQPSPSDGTLIEQASNQGMGIIAFSALAQGLLTDRYLGGVPTDSRAARGGSLPSDTLTDELVSRLRSLNVIAQRHDQSLAQLAIAWVLRDERVTSALIGASSVKQLETSLGALQNLTLDDDELAELDTYAVDAGVNRWAKSSNS